MKKRTVTLSDEEWLTVERALSVTADVMEATQWQINETRLLRVLSKKRATLRDLRYKIQTQRRVAIPGWCSRHALPMPCKLC